MQLSVYPTARLRARTAGAIAVVAVALPLVAGRLGGPRVRVGGILDVELAGSGERLLALTGGDAEYADRLRMLLGKGDNAYVAVYVTPLLLGASLLPTDCRRFAFLVVAATAVSDVVENVALDRALVLVRDSPERPEMADPDAVRARLAAIVKFGLLVPAVGLASCGVVRNWNG